MSGESKRKPENLDINDRDRQTAPSSVHRDILRQKRKKKKDTVNTVTRERAKTKRGRREGSVEMQVMAMSSG